MMKIKVQLLLSMLIVPLLVAEAQPDPEKSYPSSYTEADATAALKAFNKHFYSDEAKLYFETTEQEELGSIWTQAIFWDIIMDAYERTGDEQYEQMIHDIYEGGYQEYAGYNWENKEEWFIYDDIMWWVIGLARAHQITGKQKYLELSQSGFARVW